MAAKCPRKWIEGNRQDARWGDERSAIYNRIRQSHPKNPQLKANFAPLLLESGKKSSGKCPPLLKLSHTTRSGGPWDPGGPLLTRLYGQRRRTGSKNRKTCRSLDIRRGTNREHKVEGYPSTAVEKVMSEERRSGGESSVRAIFLKKRS